MVLRFVSSLVLFFALSCSRPVLVDSSWDVSTYFVNNASAAVDVSIKVRGEDTLRTFVVEAGDTSLLHSGLCFLCTEPSALIDTIKIDIMVFFPPNSWRELDANYWDARRLGEFEINWFLNYPTKPR
jgi:hypothetical protein